jgi:hypothetical protein
MELKVLRGIQANLTSKVSSRPNHTNRGNMKLSRTPTWLGSACGWIGQTPGRPRRLFGAREGTDRMGDRPDGLDLEPHGKSGPGDG